MPTLAIVLAGFGTAIILFPALLSLLVGIAFISAGAAVFFAWRTLQEAKGAAARKSMKVGGVEIIFPEKK